MGAAPNNNYNPNGRPKGSANQTTTEIKQAFALLLAGRQEELNDALNQLRDKDPRGYLEMYLKLSNKFLPDVSRTEISGIDGEPFQPIQIVLPKKDE